MLKDPYTKLFDQFTKHFQVSQIASGNTTNVLKQIQKQLTQIDKSTTSSNQKFVFCCHLTEHKHELQIKNLA